MGQGQNYNQQSSNQPPKGFLTKTWTFIGVIALILGMIASVITIKQCNPLGNELIYRGTVQDKGTKEYIAGAEITFPGYTDEILFYRTDNFGSFKFELSKEYPNIKIRIEHKDYATAEFNRKLTKEILENSSGDIIQLVPIRQQQTINQEPTIEIKPIKERKEATGISGFKINSKWAWEEAEQEAYKNLLRILNETSIAYEIDNERSSAYLVDGEGYQAKIVIYTYK